MDVAELAAGLSTFIISTCQLLPKLYDVVSDRIYIKSSGPGQKSKTYAMFSGSSAEFFIRPMSPIIEDNDRIIWKSNVLAFIEDFPVLPNDVSSFDDTIKCCKIEPYLNYPGFVRLRVLGEMNYYWKWKMYTYCQVTLPNEYINFDVFGVDKPNEYTESNFTAYNTSWSSRPTMKGPSIRRQIDPRDIKLDDVHSVWCPQWPKEAHDWPKRAREFGWPTLVTISEVVQQGCHVVYVQHRSCRDDVYQWRFSFSVAEIILLQSWTQVQQIVYHMLRFLCKKELIQQNCPKEDEVLCTYHLKTLMLWTCEEMSPEWWNSSVVVICCELLRRLSEWFKRRNVPNYFIPEANLFHEPARPSVLDEIERRLSEFRNSRKFCHWFFQMYIFRVIQQMHYSDFHFSRCKTEINMYHVELVDYMLWIIDFREDKIIYSLNIFFENMFAHYSIHFLYLSQEYGQRSCLDYIHLIRNFKLLKHSTLTFLPIPKNISCFRYFDKALYCLHVANCLRCGKMYWMGKSFVDHMKAILFKPKIVRCQYHNFPEPCPDARSQLQFRLAQGFVENLAVSNSPSEFRLVSLMLTEFLIRSLECDDSQWNGTASVALAYHAALYFASSEHRVAIALCSAVLNDHRSLVGNETLDASCLFFIDDIVKIMGLCLLCKKLKENVHFDKRQIYLDLRLSTKLFAYYLMVKFAKDMLKQSTFNHYPTTPTYDFDQFLLVLTERMYMNSTSTMSSTCLQSAAGKDALVAIATLRMDPVRAEEKSADYLIEYAFENMTSFYSALLEHYGVQGNTVDCYRALYLYKCRRYEDMLNICERILQTSGLENDLKELVFANVLILPPFDSFFDIDVKSLFGFNTLFCYLSPRTRDLSSSIFIADFLSSFVFSLDEPLEASFGRFNPNKCHYFIGRHFLARYLIVRYCIDFNQMCAEAMAEFSATKIIFPFEHIIRRFALRNF